jgi:tetratricopeptide (TPR) repeat protein
MLLVAVTLVLYSPVLRHGFVSYDDDRYVTGNPQVQTGLTQAMASWAFTTFEQANWHPVTWLSHASDVQLFHLNAAGHHFTSVLLHAINVLLLFLILRWFTGYTGRSFMVAALFAVHPLNVESVAWVAERKSVLSMLFFLLAVAAYGWYLRKPGVPRYLAITILFAAGLMSKPMVITLPFVLVLLDYWPLGRMRSSGDRESRVSATSSGVTFAASSQSFAKLCLEKIPLLALSAGSAIITMIAQRAGGAVVSTGKISLLFRLENSILSYGLYIKKMVWPSRLAVIYPYPESLPIWQVVASAFFLLGITWLVLKNRQFRYLCVGWFWYLGTMVPMIGLVQVGNQARADRYAYLPLIGLFVMVVWAAADAANSRRVKANYVVVAGIATLVALSWVTHVQLTYWQDDLHLWTHTLAVNPRNFVAENNLGLTLIRQGQRDKAIAHFRAAATLAPADPTSQLNLGIYAQEQGDYKEAAERYQKVLKLANDDQLRASAYANLGTIYFALHDYPRAQQNFAATLKLQRVFPITLRDLGLMALRSGDWNQAIRYFSWLVSIQPTDVDYFLLAQSFHQASRDDDARWAYQQAAQLSRDISQTKQIANQLAVQ